jgi:RNA polymerase sigma-70 factor (ECF subfamily)
VARRSYAKLVAFLASRSGDVAGAEDALSDAFAAALADWPKCGCPANPEAWLMTAARRRMIDASRKRARGEAAAQELARLAETMHEEAGAVPDRRLGLLFACAHPAIDEGVRAPLMLQAVVGLDAKRIASAFLTSPAAMGKRLVRAKERIRVARIPLRIPEREELLERLPAVLDAIYAAFAEGWSDEVRGDLSGEAIFLGRVACELMPGEAEALGLLSLMLHSEARRAGRRNEAGEFVPLEEQDVERWDWRKIEEAERLLREASALGVVGRYQMEAALQSAHVFRRRTGMPNWDAVVELYDVLWRMTASPVVAVNRAVAVGESRGACAGLEALPDAETDARLREYQPYWAARAELLARAGRASEARVAYDLAIGLERDAAVRRFLQGKRAALVG